MFERVGLLLLVVGVMGQQKSLVMRHTAKMEDQRAAESGYLVKTDAQGPVSYMMFNSATGNLKNFNYHPIVLPKLPIPYVAKVAYPVSVQDVEEVPNVAKIDYPEKMELLEATKADEKEEVVGLVKGVDDYLDERNDGYSEDDKGEEYSEDETKGNLDDSEDEVKGGDDGKIAAYSEGNGEEHAAGEHSSEGSKGSKGYKSEHAHKSAEKGKSEKEQHKGHYAEEGGSKKAHDDSSGHHSSSEESGGSTQGGSFSVDKNHKKGSKTTGFHKVYHKDEYKKDHSFYDESDASGHYDKYGKSGSHHSHEEGGFKKGGKSDAGYHKDGFGKKGSYDKGKHSSKDSGFKGEKGAEEFYNNYADYAKEGGNKGEKAYGYAQGSGKKE